MNPYVRIFLIMVCFGMFHTLTGRQAIKTAVCSRTGIGHATYTIVRSSTSFSLLLLSLVALFRDAEATRALFSPILGLPAIVPSMFAFWIAGMALGQVAKDRRLPQFFGVKEYPKVFFYSGAYSICRHPMYAGWLMASWGILLSKPYLLTVIYNTLITLFVVYESLQEEKRMTELFGERYLNYKKDVPFLVPYGFLKDPNRGITGK
jgi:protein-S-isoprenylcysteine O-methyltransferase Ste14